MAFNEAQIRKSLSDLGQSLALPEASDNFGRAFINNTLLKKIKTSRTPTRINRTRILGSAGKHTGIWVKMDYDCVVFVNKDPLPWEVDQLNEEQQNILEEWEMILDGKVDLEGRRLVASFKGVDVDLLVGFNAVANQDVTPSSQKQSLLNLVKRRPMNDRVKLSKAYSFSFSEYSAEFMSKQSGVVHKLVRIVKLWITFSGLIDRRVGGKGIIIEMICVEARKKIADKNNILEGFRKVLHILQNSSSMRINEEETNFLDGTERRKVLKLPFIIDPANPYNNLLKSKNVPFFLNELQQAAQKTAHKIGKTFTDKVWKNLMISLYIKESAARCGFSRVRSLYISEKENVHMPQVIKASTSVEAVSDKLMRFICCVAAFIPKKEHGNQIRAYASILSDALTYFKTDGLKVHFVRGVQGVHFEMVYPLETKGIWIGAVMG